MVAAAAPLHSQHLASLSSSFNNGEPPSCEGKHTRVGNSNIMRTRHRDTTTSSPLPDRYHRLHQSKCGPRQQVQRAFELYKRSREAYIDYKIPLPRIDEEKSTSASTIPVTAAGGSSLSWVSLCDDDDDDDTIYPRQDSRLFRDHHHHHVGSVDIQHPVEGQRSATSQSECYTDATHATTSTHKTFESGRYQKPVVITVNVTQKGVVEFISRRRRCCRRGRLCRYRNDS